MNGRELRRYLCRRLAAGLQAEHRRLETKPRTHNTQRLIRAVLELESELWRKGTEYAKPGEVERVDKEADRIRRRDQLSLDFEEPSCSKD